METVHQMIGRTQTVNPVQPKSRIVGVTKNADGSLECRQASGESFTIPVGEDTMQAFAIWTVLHNEA